MLEFFDFTSPDSLARFEFDSNEIHIYITNRVSDCKWIYDHNLVDKLKKIWLPLTNQLLYIWVRAELLLRNLNSVFICNTVPMNWLLGALFFFFKKKRTT